MTEQPDDLSAHRPLLRAFILRLLGDATLAEDLAQETLLRAHCKQEEYRGEASIRSWLCAIALNLVRDHYRKSGRSPVTTNDEKALQELPAVDDPEATLLESEMAACIGEHMLQLPRPQYEVVTLHDAAGLNHTEIAGLLGITVANSRVLLHRGRSALREILEANCALSFDGDPVPCERKPGY